MTGTGTRARTLYLRTLLVCGVFQLRMLLQYKFYVIAVFVQPLAFALIQFVMVGHRQDADALAGVAVQAGLMGMWTSTLFGSGGGLSRERRFGTLEPVVVAPTPLAVNILAISLATALMGVISMAVTLLLGGLVFDTPMVPARPGVFAAALVVAVLANACLGFLMANAFILYRNSLVLTNLLEYPVWVLSGLMVPVAFLPQWCRPLSEGLSLTWAGRALGHAMSGTGAPGREILWCAVTGLACLGLALFFLRTVHDAVRRRATLNLI
ncbi:ABC transporter permease [Streptomyces sp. HB132]|uniref:ABC transporter permease n=1 Tax=Streptomyces sp. HB132 TaxID=767388 RepID=UPI00196030B3|nr:ABC transporter permease [Streptomyces sp. HB132]MBM7440685.1 ABC-2 type transport system permease protein [Streptomyces sp. HB132]